MQADSEWQIKSVGMKQFSHTLVTLWQRMLFLNTNYCSKCMYFFYNESTATVT